MLQVAKLVTDQCEELCIVRDISSGGLKIESYCAVQMGDRVRIAFRNGLRVSGRVAWSDASFAGIQFDYPIDTDTLLARGHRDVMGYSLRAPRLKIAMPSVLRVHREEARIQLRDISQDGCRLESSLLLKPGVECEIDLPGLGYRRATVRWYREGEAGVLLNSHLAYQEFSAWRRRSIVAPH